MRKTTDTHNNAILGQNREDVIKIYRDNPITLSYIMKNAQKGDDKCIIFSGRNDYKIGYYKIGTKKFDNGIKSVNNINKLSSKYEETPVRQGCETVTELFMKANNENKWNFKIHADCTSRYPTIKISW